MAAETTYEVNAKLQLQGKFEAQMKRASRSIDPVQRKMQRLARTVQKFARGMQGASLQMGRFAKMGALAGGAAAGGGIFAMVTAGFRYNKVQEDTIQNLATMNAFYKVGNRYVTDATDKTALFAANTGLAATMWDEMLVRQQETPAGVNQLAQLMQGAMAGVAQVNKPLDKQLDLLTKLSMLGPALANDYKQLGADTMRILTGGAGQDVLTFRLMRNEIFAAVKASGALGKNIKNNDKFVKRFNMELNETQKFEFMETAMKTLGPRFKKMFGESMSGLTSASKSKLAQISGAFTTPMYLGFREFLRKANMEKGGLLNTESLKKLIGIAAYFGNVVGDVFKKFLGGFERIMAKARDNWSGVADGFMLMWDTAITLLKLAIVGALGRKAAGMFAGAIGKAMEGLSKGKSAIEKAGGGMKGVKALIPSLLGFGAITVAAAVVGTIVAGMAAYLIGNWKRLAGELIAGWDTVSDGIIKVWVVAMNLWEALMLVGAAFLGTTDGVEMATGALDILLTVLQGVGVFIQLIAGGMIALNFLIAGFQKMIGGLLTMQGELIQHIPYIKGFGKIMMGLGRAYTEAGDENIADAAGWQDTYNKIDELRGRKPTDRQLAEGEEKTDTMLAWLKKYLKSKGGVPTSGVNINNQYNQWDLRNTDPDRIMSAFVPKLEQMADQRTQSYEALDQGV